MSDTGSITGSVHDELIIDDEGTESKCVRPDINFHRFVVRITESNWFNGFIMITIVMNALTMALETDHGLKARFLVVFDFLDELFLGIYTLEFIMKIYAEPIKYFYSSYNLFDLLVLLISYVQVLVTALIDTIRNSIVNVVLLLLLLMFLFSIMGYYIFGYKDSATESDKEHWGDLGSAMLSLFNYVTVEGWTDLQQELDAPQYQRSRLYTILFIFLGHFIFTNVFIGLVIMNIHEATENYRREQAIEREQVVQRKKEYMIQRQHNEVRQMLEKQNRGQYKDFYDMVKEFQSTLRHDDYVISVDLATNLTWVETTITSLDHMENTVYRLQMLHFEMVQLLAMVLEKKLKERYGM